ncbi:TRICHOME BIREFRINGENCE-LIKE 9 [Arabidopsis thaliana]|jgi:hypothetical protein|uniref:TRICHOME BIREFRINGENCE-LIKE 9 n=1 Tax=Arabidopsis thaliana TaxID=3702 RepID=A0A1P8BE49_ARATH|nr:TRICHOME BIREFRINGENCE-LIKE 9 [Arabidopsis thaliana]ANM69870.1 TRICHOME BIREFRINGENCE-LIKE 9 [Arabidopsis thaliana]|eukprot:NP_001331517.1 TRICHOME BIREFRINGENCE-LIKE 9 [Arabidopsis thaliana]
MDHHQLFSLCSFSYIFKIKKHLFVSLFLLSLLIFSTVVVDVMPSLRIGLLSSSSSQTVTKECDYSKGKWVRRASSSSSSVNGLFYGEECRFLDSGFRCHKHGRKDSGYLDWRWQPHGCDLPRFNASDLLERSRNGRIVFVGDSIGRNQWESLMCMLSQAIPNKSEIYEVNGNPITKHKGFLSMRFPRENLTVEYHRSPFLVVIGRPPDKSPKEIKTTVRVDEFNWQSKRWVGSDVLVFNSGHWWNEDKTVLTGCYFEEGRKVNKTMGVMEAFGKSLKTWKSWVLEKLDPDKSYVFFRSYSPVHYRLGQFR